MNNAKIISVNPGIKTLGELNINEINLSRLSRTISNPGQRSSHVKDILNFVFGLNSKVNTQFSNKMLSIRILGGLLMTGLGMSAYLGSSLTAMPQMLALTTGIFGISLLSGCLTRVVSLLTAAVGAFFIYQSIGAGVLDMSALLVAITAVFSVILGPGHYSVDMFLRRSLHRIYRHANRYDPERNASKLNFEYNAFASVDDRLR